MQHLPRPPPTSCSPERSGALKVDGETPQVSPKQLPNLAGGAIVGGLPDPRFRYALSVRLRTEAGASEAEADPVVRFWKMHHALCSTLSIFELLLFNSEHRQISSGALFQRI